MKHPQLRLDEQGFISLLRNCRQSKPARILMISRPSQRDYLSRLLRRRTDQSFCPDAKSQKEKHAATSTCLGTAKNQHTYRDLSTKSRSAGICPYDENVKTSKVQFLTRIINVYRWS